MTDQAPSDFTEIVNQHLGGHDSAMGLRYQMATPEEVVATMTAGAIHLQAYGIVHGGVLSGMIESLVSVGAALNTMPRGQSSVGLENSTSFVRAVREGRTLTGRAAPLARGRRSHVWNATIHDDEGNLVATGRVRLLVLDGNAEVAGETVRLKTGEAT